MTTVVFYLCLVIAVQFTKLIMSNAKISDELGGEAKFNRLSQKV